MILLDGFSNGYPFGGTAISGLQRPAPCERCVRLTLSQSNRIISSSACNIWHGCDALTVLDVFSLSNVMQNAFGCQLISSARCQNGIRRVKRTLQHLARNSTEHSHLWRSTKIADTHIVLSFLSYYFIESSPSSLTSGYRFFRCCRLSLCVSCIVKVIQHRSIVTLFSSFTQTHACAREQI